MQSFDLLCSKLTCLYPTLTQYLPVYLPVLRMVRFTSRWSVAYPGGPGPTVELPIWVSLPGPDLGVDLDYKYALSLLAELLQTHSRLVFNVADGSHLNQPCGDGCLYPV